MVDAATEFKKSGFSEEDSATLAQLSSMFQNVADEEINAGDAANFLISQMVAFNIEAQNSEHIVDAINETANRFAVSSGQLSQGLSIAASSSSVMGNSLEETMGLMVAITEVTRNSSKAAKGISSIMSELANVLDPVSSNGEKIKTIFAELGISMMENGQLRTGYELLKDLANEWNNLDGNTQKYIATTIAGKTQINNFVALMGNFEHAVQATEVAYDSAGSAIRENAAYMDSLEAKTTALKATFQDLANNVIDKELVSDALSLLNWALNLVNDDLGALIIRYGLLTGTITGGLTIWGSLLQNLFGVQNVFGALIPAGAKFSTVLGTIAVKALPIAGLASGVFFVLYDIYKTLKEANPTLEETAQNLESANTQLAENEKRLKEINKLPWNERTPEILAEKDALIQENEQLREQIEAYDNLRVAKIRATAQETLSGASRAQVVNADGTTEWVAGWRTNQRVVTEVKQGAVVYKEITQELNKYKKILDDVGKLNDEQIVEYNDLVAEASRYATAMENVEGGVKSCTVEQQEMYNALKQAEGAYTAAVNYVSDYVNRLIDQQKQSGAAKDELYNLVKAEIIAENQKLDFSQQIQALALLAEQAGATAAGILAVTGLSSADINRTIGGLLQTGQAKTREEAQQIVLERLYKKMFDVKPTSQTSVADIGTGDTDTKKATDKALEQFKTLQAQIKHQLEMGEIDQTAYYNALEKLVAQYKEDAIAHMKEYGLTVEKIDENMYSFEEEIYKGRIELIEKANEAAKNALEQQKSNMETAVTYLMAKIEDEIDALEKQKQAINDEYDERIENLNAENAALEEQIEYEEKLNQLAKAKSQQVYVFKDGQFQYVQDVSAISAAQSELDAYNREKQLNDEVKRLEKLREAAVSEIDTMIDDWEEYKAQWSDVVDQYTTEQNRLIAEQELGINFEQKNWQTRLMNAQEFAEKYNAIISSIGQLEAAVQEEKKAGSGSYSYSGKAASSNKGAGKGTYEIGSEKGKSFVENAKAGSTMTGGDGSTWVKNKDGSTTISKGGNTWTVGGYASGTLSARGGLSLVGENGPELRVLNNNDGVIPADITRNLWDWGKFNPKSMMSTMSNVFNIDNLTLPNARDAETLISGLRQMAYQRAYKRA